MPMPTTPDATTAGSGTDPAAVIAVTAAVTAAAVAGADARATAGAGPAPVLAGRAQIDALDTQIGELILRRIEVSRAIQAARIADGGRRIDLRRESEIINHYRAALGKPGTAIAMALLELCRGRA